MYQFCFCAKNAQFFCGPNSDLMMDIPKGNFIKAGSADCGKPCSERSERCAPRDRRDAFVHVKRLDLLH